MAWFTALAVIFGVMLVYVVLWDVFMNTLPDMCVSMGVPSDDATLATLRVVFVLFPLLMVFGILAWAFAEQQRNEPRGGAGFY